VSFEIRYENRLSLEQKPQWLPMRESALHEEALLPRSNGAAYIRNMNPMVTHSVNEIPDAARRTLEDLLGRHLEANQKVCLVVLTPPEESDEETRRQAVESIRRRLLETDQSMAARGITTEEFDAAVDEAMEQIRPRPS
jgi:hypothetical protein